MDRIAGQSAESYFGMLPETFIWSDKISHNGIRVLAVLYARWTGKFWPVLTNDEISRLSGLSASTIKGEVAALKVLGLIKATRTKDGNRYELIVIEFDDDTYRGRIKVSRAAHAKVFIHMTASSISSAALRLWLMLDRIGRTNEWVTRNSQRALARYMGVGERRIRAYLDELRDAGLVESRRPDPSGKNEYRLIRTPVMVGDTRESHRTAAIRVTRWWLTAVLGDDARTWAEENADEARAVYCAVHEAVQLIGEPETAQKIAETVETYGTDYPPDFIVKVLDEWLTDLGYEYDEPDEDHTEPAQQEAA